VSGRRRKVPYALDVVERRWLYVYVPLFAVLLYLPSFMILLFSLNDGIYVAFPLKGFTTMWYEKLAANDALLRAARNSFAVGFFAATFATIFGTLGAFAIVRYKLRLAKALTVLANLPLLIPAIILGIAMLVLLRFLGFDNSLWAIAFGHVVVCTPLSLSVMLSRFVDLDPALEEAALDLGANERKTFFVITLPLSLSAIASSFILCFTTSFDEFVVAFFLSGPEQTLPLYIWGQLRFPTTLPMILALGSVVLGATLALVVFSDWLRRRGPKLQTD
jgi:spermidine/putrescine transport system permease protein